MTCFFLQLNKYMFYFCVSAVPAPNVSVSVPSGPLYEGTTQTLTCTATLPLSVDTDTNVTVFWTHNGTNISSDLISQPMSPQSPFTSTLTIRPLVMTDAGRYSCEASADSSSQYITPSGIRKPSEQKPLTVSGMVTESLSLVQR